MNDGSLNTIRKYIEFNAKENPHSDFVTCSHTNHKISNIQLKINLDKTNFYLVNKKKQKKIANEIKLNLNSKDNVKFLMVEENDIGPQHLFSGEKLSPVLTVLKLMILIMLKMLQMKF
jgi:hypothetical protein